MVWSYNKRTDGLSFVDWFSHNDIAMIGNWGRVWKEFFA